MKFSRSKPPRPRAKPRPSGEVSRQAGGVTSEQNLLWTVVIALFAAGAVMVYSASSATGALNDGDPLGYLKRYLVIGGAGLILMRLASRFDLSKLREFTPLILAGAFMMLVLVLIPGFGVEVNGARRWLGAGVLRFQPSEVMKLALVLYTAMLIADNPQRVRNLRSMAEPLFWVIGGAGALIMLQPDMGTDLVIVATMGTMLIAAGAKLQDLAKVLGVLAVLVLLLSILEPYRMARITAFLNPSHDPTGIGYQSEQARIAIGSGGLFGVGIGESIQKVHYMPEAHTDMILAVIGEELGLMGIVGLCLLYFALIVGGLRAAKNSRDIYARILAIGITSMVACQALLNFFAVMGMAPLTGVPLPFISYGGANLMIMLVAMGLLINVASGRHTARVRVLRGGGRDEITAHRTRRSEPNVQKRAAAAGAAPRTRGHYEDRDRRRGNGGSRRSSPGSR